MLFQRTLSRSTRKCLNVKNEPVLSYEPGSRERDSLLAAVSSVKNNVETIPVVINGSDTFTDETMMQVCPYDHQRSIAKVSLASKKMIGEAIVGALRARESWERMPLMQRAKIFLDAAEKLSGPVRPLVNATTMVGQAKTIVQAEIDAACELVDFLRFNCMYAMQQEGIQPLDTSDATNESVYRGLEGFVAAVAPFNFTAISGNLATAPAIMGNCVLWKPADTAVLSSFVVYRTLLECGLPEGVIQFIPAVGGDFGDVVLNSPSLAALNFTGSTATFKKLWTTVGCNLDIYKNFPRIVGETGGKNFHMVHPSADMESVVGATIRSAFEYQGQKCSACSRMYVPKSMWPSLKKRLQEECNKVEMGPADNPKVLVSAVIDKKSFDKISGYIEYAQKSESYSLVSGGKVDDSVGYFVEPTIFEVNDPTEKLMKEEIFGPVLTVFPYDDKDAEKMLDLIDNTSPYALTGAVFSLDDEFVALAKRKLRYAVGNMYINDKSTGSVVAQQPFGGARMSGTNDKAGSPSYISRFCSPLAIKTAIGDRHVWTYPSMK